MINPYESPKTESTDADLLENASAPSEKMHWSVRRLPLSFSLFWLGIFELFLTAVLSSMDTSPIVVIIVVSNVAFYFGSLLLAKITGKKKEGTTFQELSLFFVNTLMAVFVMFYLSVWLRR